MTTPGEPRPRRGRGGRPRSTAPRHKGISVRLSEAERATLEAAAGPGGIADLLRSAALGREPAPAPRIIPEVHATAWIALGQGLGNLNQAVKLLHHGAETTVLLPVLDELRRDVRSLRAVLLGGEP